MKLVCDKFELQAAIQTAGKASAPKSPIPALEGLLLKADENLTITGYDLKKGIYTSIDANISEKGSIVLDSRLFSEIIRSLPDGKVTIQTKDDSITHIKSGKSDFNIMGISAEDYPELPTIEPDSSIILSQKALKNMIGKTIFAVSDNESKPVYTGSLFKIVNNQIEVVSVDGYRIAVCRDEINSEERLNLEFIVPGSALKDLEKLCSDSDDSVLISVGKKHLSFVVSETTLITRKLEGDFLDYKKSLPKEFEINLKVNRDNILKSVERVSLIIDEKVKTPIKLSFGPDLTVIQAQTPYNKAEELCPLEGDGKSLEIGFNNRYLIDMFKAISAESFMMRLSNSTSPMVLEPVEGSDFLFLTLPVRLRSN
ncbi:DNA polymerase III subunit beta [Clostridiaceae bacterium OttesenSCG-928-D20]|nr:DNA polymerase III subunit beta [Clostridiaceae bacterium OttesenSCG-928-D20]